MRVAMVCPYSLTVPGGVQNQVIGLTRRLRDRGHMVVVVAPCDGRPPIAGVFDVGTTVMNPSNGSIAPIAPHAANQRLFRQVMKDYTFDVIHLHEPLVPGPTVSASLLKPAPLLGTFHAAGDASEYKKYARVARAIGGRIDALVAVSEAARQMASTAVVGDWEVLFNGVEIDEFDGSRRSQERDDFVLFLGRHEPRKGLGVLLDAYQESGIDRPLVVAGDGPETKDLRHRFGHLDSVTWLGRVSNEERNELLSRCAWYVAPALGGESFGIVLVEAMASGAPVVASDIEGFRSVVAIADGSCAALLCEAGSSSSLSAALRELDASSQYRDELSRRGLAHAQQYSMERLTECYESRYSRLASGMVNHVGVVRP